MNIRIVSQLVAVATVTLAVAASAEAGQLTLADAIERSIAASPSVAIAASRIDAASASIDEAEAARWPRISVNGSVFQYEEPMVVTPFHGFGPGMFPEFDDTLLQSSLNVELLVWDGGGTPARIRASEADEKAARSSEVAARDALIVRTAATYLTVLIRTHQLESHDARIEALEAEKERVRQWIGVGRAAEVDRLRIEAALAAATAERSSVATGLETAKRDLVRLLGIDEDATSIEVADVRLTEWNPGDREAIAASAIDNNPAVARARDELRQREASVTLARSIYFPQVRAVGSWLQFSDDSFSFDDEWNVGIRVRVPIWDGGVTSARVARARSSVLAAREQIRLEELRVLDHLDASLASLADADANVESLEVAVSRFEEVARIENLRLTAGAGTQADYLRSEADLLQARAGLAAARYRRVLARIELGRVLGRLDPSWFRQHTTTPISRSDS